MSQCRAALDLAFTQAARAHDASTAESSGSDEEINAEVQAVLEEIRSLWDETAPVAHMVAEKELLAPITKRVNRMSAKSDAQQHAAVQYVGFLLARVRGPDCSQRRRYWPASNL